MRANNHSENLNKIYDEYCDEFDDLDSLFKWHEKQAEADILRAIYSSL